MLTTICKKINIRVWVDGIENAVLLQSKETSKKKSKVKNLEADVINQNGKENITHVRFKVKFCIHITP